MVNKKMAERRSAPGAMSHYRVMQKTQCCKMCQSKKSRAIIKPVLTKLPVVCRKLIPPVDNLLNSTFLHTRPMVRSHFNQQTTFIDSKMNNVITLELHLPMRQPMPIVHQNVHQNIVVGDTEIALYLLFCRDSNCRFCVTL